MKIQLKRSNQVEADGSAKKPTAAQMEYGELAVNYNNADPAIFLENDNGEIIRIAGAGSSGAPVVGDGTITINNADGTENASFTVNQDSDTTITLTAGFSGDYNDLTNQPGLQEVTDINSITTNGITAAEFNPGADGAGNFRIDLLPNISTAPKA